MSYDQRWTVEHMCVINQTHDSVKNPCLLMKFLPSVHQEEKQSGSRPGVSGENQINEPIIIILEMLTSVWCLPAH